MKALIAYSSKSGNTKKLAEAVTAFLAQGGFETTFCAMDEAPDPQAYDLVAVGFWLQAGKPEPKSSDFLAGIGSKKLFLFATHGAAADSAHAANAMAHAASLAPSAEVVGFFNCQGEVNPSFLEKARQKDPQPPWLNDAPKAVGHPDPSDLNRLTEVLKTKLDGIVK